MTLAGLRSRCTTPFSCAAVSASASGDRQLEHAGDRQPARRDEIGEALALDQLHGEEADVRLVLDRVERDDVGVIEPGHGARLALEAGEAIGVRGDVGGQHLDRDVAAEARSRARYTSPIPPAPSGATIS